MKITIIRVIIKTEKKREKKEKKQGVFPKIRGWFHHDGTERGTTIEYRRVKHALSVKRTM